MGLLSRPTEQGTRGFPTSRIEPPLGVRVFATTTTRRRGRSPRASLDAVGAGFGRKSHIPGMGPKGRSGIASIAVEETLNDLPTLAAVREHGVVEMNCERCGEGSEGDWQVCPRCGQAREAIPAPVVAPGTVGPPRANGSDEVRNSKGPAAKPAGSDTIVDKPASTVVEGTGG
jgi:hypothetical protein